MKSKRLFYTILFLVLLLTEILIGVLVHDSFVRPYLGDVLVVVVLYALIRVFIPKKFPWLPVAIFIFAAAVECLQGLHIADMLGIENHLLRTIIGTQFDFNDIICYGVGCAALGIYEFVLFRLHKTK